MTLKIILGEQYKTYDKACLYFDIEKLSLRRLELCTNYVIKLYQSDLSADFFTPTNKTVTRGDHPLLVEETSRTARYYNYPHIYYTQLVNQNEERLKMSTK